MSDQGDEGYVQRTSSPDALIVADRDRSSGVSADVARLRQAIADLQQLQKSSHVRTDYVSGMFQA